jgi:dihydrodipicolinate synthase/N-acetylneuraminate lyase
MEQIRGIVLPSPTVFLDDGRVDEKLMNELTDWYLACGVQAFFVLGSYGQGPALTPDGRKKVAETIIIFLRLAGPFGRTVYCEAMRLRGFDVKMYPRWPSKPLSREAYDELRDLFAELDLLGAQVKAKSA